MPLIASASDYFEDGKEAFYNNQFYEAETLFKKELAKNPINFPCRYFLGHTYVNLDKVDEARKQYSLIIMFSPNSTISKLAQQSLYNLNLMIKDEPPLITGDNYLSDVKLNGRYVKWEKFPVLVYVNASQYDTLIKSAFNQWQKMSSGIISFQFVKNPDVAQIKVRMVDKLLVDKVGKYQAGLTTVKVHNNYLKSADIQILKINPYDMAEIDNDTVYSTMLHEIGHALGLQGHSSNDTDLMAPYTKSGYKTFSRRDINTILLLYSKKESR